MSDNSAVQLPSVEGSNPPRLGIIHFLVWMAVTGIIAALNSNTDAMDWPVDIETRVRLTRWMGSLYRAAAVTVFWITISGYLRGHRWKVQPGEFFAIVFGAIVLLACVVDIVNQWNLALYSFPIERLYRNSNFEISFYSILVAIACALGAIRMGYTNWWRAALWINSATELLIATMRLLAALNLQYEYQGIYGVMLNKIVLAAVLYAVFMDQRRHLKRSWLHWAGIGIVSSYVLFDVFQHFVLWRV